MAFLHSVIGDNTKENREHLKKIGYKKWVWDDDDYDIPFISTMLESKKYAAFTQDEVEGFQNDIDCRNNPALFQAVTAVRDDSDYMQFFIINTTMNGLFANKEICLTILILIGAPMRGKSPSPSFKPISNVYRKPRFPIYEILICIDFKEKYI